MVTIEASEKRKYQVLLAIVEEYARHAQPVGSQYLWQKHDWGVSPATIRNIMMELEAEGYIQQPHTSAGRIPTDKGYRFYVNRRITQQPIKPRDSQWIREQLAEKQDEEDAIRESLRLTSQLTHYVTVTMRPNGHVMYTGVSYIAKEPEFENVKHLNQLVELLEEENDMKAVLQEYMDSPDAIHIKIGSENKARNMRSCSVVVSRYHADRKEAEPLAIVGPTRMLYQRTAEILAAVSQELDHFFNPEKEEF